MISINTPHTGVLNPHFIDYDADMNKWLIYYCVRHTPQTAELPEELLDSSPAIPRPP
jgi:hypothetical protein